MGTVYKATYSKPLPQGADLFTRGGERWAKWTDAKGRNHKARVTGKADRLLIESATYTAKYRTGGGVIVKVSTGCRTLDAAKSVLMELETRADKVRSGKWTAAEDAVLDHQATPIAEHVAAYIDRLRVKTLHGRLVSAHYVANVEHNLKRIMADCGFKLLRDMNRAAVEKWAAKREAGADGTRVMSAGTINTHLTAACAFGNWCVESRRAIANPFARLDKRNERGNRVRQRRALTEDELRRLLKVAKLRSLAEYGRETVRLNNANPPADNRTRRTWTKAPLTHDTLDAVAERGRRALAKRPDFIAGLDRAGRERGLIYKTLVLTGLRKGELASLTIGQLELDGPMAYAVLHAADEKAGRGADIPLRGDIAADVRAYRGTPGSRQRASKGKGRSDTGAAPHRRPAVQRADGPCPNPRPRPCRRRDSQA